MGLGTQSLAPIDESIGLLNTLNKEALNKIRNANPDFRAILETGVVGGLKEISIRELTVRADISRAALEESLKQTRDKYLPHLRKKLKFLQQIELWTQIIIVVSSSTVFILLIKGVEKSGIGYVGPYIGAGLSLVGAILTIFLKQNSGEWSMNNQNVAHSFNSLVVSRIEAEEMLSELNLQTQFIENNKDSLSDLISKCNEVNKKIRIIIDKYPDK
jgi:hypothetical protein